MTPSVKFTNEWLVDNVDGFFSKGGDSGSLVIRMGDGKEALVALLRGEIPSPSGKAGIFIDVASHRWIPHLHGYYENPWVLYTLILSWYSSHGQITTNRLHIPMDTAVAYGHHAVDPSHHTIAPGHQAVTSRHVSV